jgi:uncharacterized protein YecE (DUF72 family)
MRLRFSPQLAERLALAERQGSEAWCIFDNTAAEAALDNALELQSLSGARE